MSVNILSHLEKLKELHKLSQLFEEGIAGPAQIKQLEELLASINKNIVTEDLSLFINNN